MPLSPEQAAEIEEQRRHSQATLRAVSSVMESHLYTAYPVLIMSLTAPYSANALSRC